MGYGYEAGSPELQRDHCRDAYSAGSTHTTRTSTGTVGDSVRVTTSTSSVAVQVPKVHSVIVSVYSYVFVILYRRECDSIGVRLEIQTNIDR